MTEPFEPDLVAEIWAEILGVNVDASTDFFAAGGDSLAAARTISRIRERTGVRLSLATLLDQPQFEDFVRAARRGDPDLEPTHA